MVQNDKMDIEVSRKVLFFKHFIKILNLSQWFILEPNNGPYTLKVETGPFWNEKWFKIKVAVQISQCYFKW